MKLFITGANGFIASHFLQTINSSEDMVLYTKHESAAEKLKKNNWKVYAGEEISRDILKNIDCAVHLGGAAGGNLEECIDGNIVFTNEIINLSQRLGIKKIVFLSGAAVYGDIKEKARETTQTNPVNHYGITKLAAEKLIMSAIHRKQIKEAVILRSNNIYGPGSDHGMISNFIQQAQRGGSVTVDGDGSQCREPLYVGDAIQAIHAAIKLKKRGISIYNISGPETLSLKDIVKKISEVSKRKLKLKLSGEKASPPRMLLLDITKARENLSWSPQVNMKEGIHKTLFK